MTRKTIIFCDFDGTITKKDMIISIMEQFAPPGWKKIKEDILSLRMSVKAGVGELFSLLPSNRKEEIVRFALERAEIRTGFSEFIHFCKEKEYQFWIVSGGIDFFVIPILSPFNLPRNEIHCNLSDFSGKTIRILWPHSCDGQCHLDCGLCKASMLRSFPPSQYGKVVIGDSISDLPAAQEADFVIARDWLLEECRKRNLQHEEFDSFYDAIAILTKWHERR